MKHGHENLHVWIAAAFVSVAGLTIYLHVPQYRIASGAAIGIVLLMVLKHVGFFLAFGAPIMAALRKWVAPLLQRKSGDDP